MGENLGKINSQRLRAAVLRIRPGKENVGQIQPWASGTVLGEEQARPGHGAVQGSWLWEIRPALLQIPLGQGLTDLGEG